MIPNTTLLSNLEQHEFGITTGHYQQYLAALALSTDNLGDIAESAIGPAEQALAAFEQELDNRLRFAGGRLIDAMRVEACNREANYDPSCAVAGQPAAFRGFVNYFPYASCP